MPNTPNKELLLEKNKHINREELEKNLDFVGQIQRLGIKKQYSLATPSEIKRVQAIDVIKETRTVNLRHT